MQPQTQAGKLLRQKRLYLLNAIRIEFRSSSKTTGILVARGRTISRSKPNATMNTWLEFLTQGATRLITFFRKVRYQNRRLEACWSKPYTLSFISTTKLFCSMSKAGKSSANNITFPLKRFIPRYLNRPLSLLSGVEPMTPTDLRLRLFNRVSSYVWGKSWKILL